MTDENLGIRYPPRALDDIGSARPRRIVTARIQRQPLRTSSCICYTTDPGYLLPTLVSAVQARRHSAAGTADVLIYCLDAPAAMNRIFAHVCEAEAIEFVPLDSKTIDGANAMLARLFLGRLLDVYKRQDAVRHPGVEHEDGKIPAQRHRDSPRHARDIQHILIWKARAGALGLEQSPGFHADLVPAIAVHAQHPGVEIQMLFLRRDRCV